MFITRGDGRMGFLSDVWARNCSSSPICLQTLGVKLLEYGQLFRAREHTTLIAQAVGPRQFWGLPWHGL